MENPFHSYSWILNGYQGVLLSNFKLYARLSFVAGPLLTYKLAGNCTQFLLPPQLRYFTVFCPPPVDDSFFHFYLPKSDSYRERGFLNKFFGIDYHQVIPDFIVYAWKEIHDFLMNFWKCYSPCTFFKYSYGKYYKCCVYSCSHLNNNNENNSHTNLVCQSWWLERAGTMPLGNC